ncbi:unnamed protein product [Candida verbasci]|uniref:L domain-like protein n=1 Tax=Candida verbasci TaxID=1227364 RepID=A0A9W4TWK3_9ASCO|nr:unnamed protein product [Candida verbasci]
MADKYQDRIKYKVNTDFNDKSSFVNLDPPSIPNTFKNKSHPNAKTKELGSNSIDETPEWMPVELNDKWIPEQLSQSAQAPQPPQPLNFTSSVRISKKDSNTMIHNSDINETPDWKKATKGFNNLKQIFEPPSIEQPKSPLKLFTDNYDTYTEQKLNGVLNNMRNTPAQAQAQVQAQAQAQVPLNKISQPKLNSIPRPTKSFADFAKKGDAIINNIKKNYNGIRVISQNTATSTPKNDKIVSIEDEYESYTSGFSSDEESVKQPEKESSYTLDSLKKNKSKQSEYTFDSLNKDKSKQSDYTFDSISQLKQENEEIRKSLEEPLIDTTPLTFDANDDSIYHEDVFKWKSKSELGPIIGRVDPQDLPIEYENMIYDAENQKWIEKNKGNYTLVGIEDLTEEIKPILKKPSRKNLEVSFQEPGNVTRISHIDEVSFSESKKRLISIITEIVQNSWNEIIDIDLQDYQLETIKDLDQMLPNLKEINLSNNNLTYLTGLTESTMSLNISNNNIQDITPLHYTNLHNLDLSFNLLTSCSNLYENIHLTTLNLSNNRITDVTNLQKLINLTDLDLSGNSIEIFNISLAHLQVLNLSKNKITQFHTNSPRLRILNLNENKLVKFSSHLRIAKLLLNANKLKLLDVSKMIDLRCLKFDSNNLKQLEIRNCLEQVSCKSQPSHIIEKINTLTNLSKLDLSGNQLKVTNPMLYITDLTLAAMNLKSIPINFSNIFPNVQNLNLNFNKLENIDNLTPLENLKKLYLVNNQFKSFKDIMRPLSNIKKSIRVLDFRLNPISQNLWPFVFTKEEDEMTIQLESMNDIDGFIDHYHELDKSNDWEDRDEIFIKSNNKSVIKKRLTIEETLLVYFINLKKLNGNKIDKNDKEIAKKRYMEKK